MKFKLLLISIFFTVYCSAQFSIATTGTNYTQDFAALTGGTWTDNTVPLTGWYAATTATATISALGTNTGSSITAGLYSFGTAAAADRAIGFAPSNAFTGTSGAGKGFIGWRLKNNTGSSISSISVTWTGEQWRRENNASSHTLNLFYQAGATVTSLTTGSWTSASSVFTSPIVGATAGAALDGNLSANRTSNIIATITVNIPAGEEIMLRWEDLNDAGNDHLLAIDDVTINATASIPSPILAITGTPTNHGSVCPSVAASSITYTITNSGSVAASGVTVVSNDPQFVVSGLSSTSIAASGGTATYSVTFTPTTAGAKTATITVASTTSGSNSPTSSLTGTGTTAVTQTVTSTAATSITSGAATLNGSNVLGVCPATTTRGFIYSLTATNSNPQVGGAGVTVINELIGAGVFSTNITGLSASTNYSYVAYVFDGTTYTYGTVLNFTTSTSAPEINVKGVIASNPSIPDGSTAVSGLNNTLFASVLLGSNQAKNFRIENTGTQNLIVTAVNLTGDNPGDFAVSGIVFPLTISPASFQDFTITFTPTVLGARNATVNIINNDSDEATYDFAIRGNGITAALVEINVKGNNVSIPDNSLFPSGLNFTAFGVAVVGSTTVTRTFTIENLGTTPLSLTGVPIVTISGFNASSFIVSVQPSSNSIAGAGSLTFDVIFNPTTLGSKNVTINILSNDADESLYNFNISGTAKGANNIYVTSNNNSVLKGATTTSITNNTNFGGVPVAGIKQNVFLITNLSTVAVTFGNVTITGPDASMFTVISNPSVNAVGAGLTTSFSINFTPTSLGQKNATATFTSNDSVDPTFSFAISGFGESFIPCTIGPVQTIAIQDFEDVPATPTWTYTNVTDGTVNIAGGTFPLPTVVNGFIGAKALQFNSLVNTTIANNVINLAPIDTSQYTNINMSMKVAALRTGSAQGLDIGDFIQIETSVDGGVNWSAEAKLAGYSNSRWSFAATGVFDAFYSGTNNGASVDTRLGGADLPAGIATYNLKFLPASTNLLIRITMSIDRIDEIWAIDNIKIEGQIPVTSTWNGSNWSPAPPTTSTKAVIEGDYSTGTNGNFVACECQIKAGKTLSIDTGILVPSNPNIEIQSNIFNEGILNVSNNASLVQVNNSATNAGTGITSVTRTTPNFDLFDYTYWSSPIKTANLAGTFGSWYNSYSFNFNTANFSDLNSGLFNPTSQIIPGSDSFDDNGDDWVKITSPATTNLSPGVGYTILGGISGVFPRTETVTFSGEVNNGLVPFTLAQSANNASTADDFNLVGNPYPSSIKADDFIKANITPLAANNNISGTLYFWTHIGNLSPVGTNPGPNINNYNSNDYATYNLSGPTGVGSPSGSGSTTPDGFIGTGQGFFVEGETTNDLIFNNSMRNKTHTNNQFFKNSNSSNEKDRLWLNFENLDNMFSQQLIAYLPETTLGFDYGYDGLGNKSQNYVSFYSFINNDQNLAFKSQSRDTFNNNDQVKLGYSSAVSGQTSISIDRFEGIFENQNIYLQDNLLNITRDLKQAPYTFTTNFGTFNDRFVLKYTNAALANNTFENAENVVNIYVKDSKISLASNSENIKSIQIFDVLGRNIFDNQTLNTKTFTIEGLTLRNQTLIVKTKLENGKIITQKIII